MFYYRIYGLRIEADLEIGAASQCEPLENIDVRICKDDIKEEISGLSPEIMADEYANYCNYGRDWSCMHFINQGIFIMEHGDKIRYCLKPGCDKVYVDQVFVCFCLSVIMIQRGQIAMHGSGVVYGDQVLLISGESGSGKSSLAAEFLKENGTFIADDTVALGWMEDTVMAYPAFSSRKLCKDALPNFNLREEQLAQIKDPQRLKFATRNDPQFLNQDMPLGAMVVIEAGDVEQVEIREITGAVKIQYLINNLYKKPAYDSVGFGREQFLQCVKIANHIPIYQLVRPRIGMTVETQVHLIEQVLG